MTSPSGDSQRPGGRAQRVRFAVDRLDGVVVAVLVRDQQQIWLHACDRGVVPVNVVIAAQRRHVAEGVDRDGLAIAVQT